MNGDVWKEIIKSTKAFSYSFKNLEPWVQWGFFCFIILQTLQPLCKAQVRRNEYTLGLMELRRKDQDQRPKNINDGSIKTIAQRR